MTGFRQILISEKAYKLFMDLMKGKNYPNGIADSIDFYIAGPKAPAWAESNESIIALRKRTGMSVRELAQFLGVGPTSIHRWIVARDRLPFKMDERVKEELAKLDKAALEADSAATETETDQPVI